MGNNQTEWSKYLSLAEFIHNSWPHDRTGYSLHQLLIGFTPNIHHEEGTSDVPAIEDQLRQIQEARTNATRLQETAERSLESRKYKENDQVWLNGRNLKTHQQTNKLVPRHYGPFQIIKVISPVVYKLELPDQWRIHNVFHIDLLSPYIETEAHGPNYE